MKGSSPGVYPLLYAGMILSTFYFLPYQMFNTMGSVPWAGEFRPSNKCFKVLALLLARFYSLGKAADPDVSRTPHKQDLPQTFSAEVFTMGCTSSSNNGKERATGGIMSHMVR